MIIAIDGTAASGKSTMAHQVAEVSGFVLMDSGLMYRAVAFGFLQHNIESTEVGAAAYLPEMQLEVSCLQSCMKIYVDREDVSSRLHTARITEMSSRVATLRNVRNFLLRLQHGFGNRFGEDPGVIAVGRDMGTVVFPDAALKFFVTASAGVRAQRRLDELSQTGDPTSFEEVRDAIIERDRQDSNRAIAPLRKALDAIVINTDDLTPDQQAGLVLTYMAEP